MLLLLSCDQRCCICTWLCMVPVTHFRGHREQHYTFLPMARTRRPGHQSIRMELWGICMPKCCQLLNTTCGKTFTDMPKPLRQIEVEKTYINYYLGLQYGLGLKSENRNTLTLETEQRNRRKQRYALECSWWSHLWAGESPRSYPCFVGPFCTFHVSHREHTLLL